ncbi:MULTISPECIES: TniQ family protein [unclassified Rhodococcus (in: high G+C Gram-positive bacteria)]|uniref:TniQ family protein n=1 Tax=unclassified Rhodococcus (in: high G+C Gram-positive bacteria) TaxID=192944 RepID=UPI00096AA89A|nr:MULTISPECIES: TniQ family protein [unclassified Rhodococcus (in: high G+C Gram-positive bacteria)]
MTGVRSLPIRVVPLPGEAIDSWLEAIAHRTGTPFVDLDKALRPDDSTAAGRVRRPNLWPMHLRPNDVDTIAAAADLAAAVVEAMTLSRYDGVALSLNGRKGRAAAGLPWGRGRRSRYCPDCLAESGGRWQLQWRLGCVFACTEHHCLLADTCPRCASVQRCSRPLREVVPSPGRCAHRSADTTRPRGLIRCDADLTSAPVMRLRPDHPAIRAQQRVLDVLTAGRGTFGVYAERPFGARVVLADLHAIASRVLAYGSIEEIADRVPADLAHALARIRSAPAPEAPALRRSELSGADGAIATAAAVTTAMTVLDRPDIAGAGEALRWLVHGGRRPGLPVDAGTICDWGSATSTVLAAIQLAALRPLFVRAVDQLRYRSAATLPSYPSASATTVNDAARRILTQLWPEWSLRFTVAPCSPAQVRPALSVALMLVGTTVRLGEAADRLGSAVRADGVTRTLACLRNSPRWDDSLIALTRLADHLAAEPPPIDYDRRRHLDYRALLPDELWHKICRRTGTPPGAGQKADFARCLLFERLSGLPASRSPFLAAGDDVRAKLSGFPRTLTPALAALLDEAAHQFLDDQGLGKEPVAWHPPLHLLDGLDLPGPDPGAVDLAALHDLTRHEHTSLSEIARQLGTTLDVIRYLLENHPAPASPTAAERFGQRAAQTAAEEALSRTQFVDLYCVQRRTLAEIAAMIGVSRKSAGRLARHHGITPAVGGPPVDPAWFHDQYVTQRRTLRELGHEVGRSVPRMSRIAKQYGIPIRPPTAAGRARHLSESH